MSQPTLNAFDAWLWSADADPAHRLRLEDLASRAAADGVKLPQLTVLTLISEGPTPGEALHDARGVEEVRRFGGVELILTSMASRGYVAAAWPTGEPGV
ncbi:MAG TPA: hypothetical protein VGG41_03905, partial [Solirubrobacteraceae bacterium]